MTSRTRRQAPTEGRASRGGGTPNRDQLVLNHLRLVHACAIRVHKQSPDTECADLVQEGILGLLGAAERYDPARGVAFTTFATPRIKGAILDHLRRTRGGPRSVMQNRRALQVAEAQAQQRQLTKVGMAEIAAELGLTPARYWTQRDLAAFGVLRFSDLAAHSEGCEPSELFADPNGLGFLATIERNDLIARVRVAMAQLLPREQGVLHAYYVEGLSYRDIGVRRRLTESRICQIARAGINRLRQLLSESRAPQEIDR